MGTRCPVPGMCVPWSRKVGREQSMSFQSAFVNRQCLGYGLLGKQLCVHARVPSLSALQLGS